MDSHFEITTETGEGYRALVLSGQLDMDSAPKLRDEIKASLKGAQTLKVDLANVDYVDSSGIAILIQGYKLALKKKVQFFLANTSPQVMAVIELSQLQDFFVFDESGGAK